METYKRGLAEATGWLVFLSLLMVLALAVPKTVFDADSRISSCLSAPSASGATHGRRALRARHAVPPWSTRTTAGTCASWAARPTRRSVPDGHRFPHRRPDHCRMVYRSVIREAIDSGCKPPWSAPSSRCPTRSWSVLCGKMNPPDRVSLDFVRIPGTGKRDGLAYGFRAISRHLPDDDAVVAVIDGDTVLDPA